eukprot:16427947-Heterocapsa_arctica.AAC.1
MSGHGASVVRFSGPCCRRGGGPARGRQHPGGAAVARGRAGVAAQRASPPDHGELNPERRGGQMTRAFRRRVLGSRLQGHAAVALVLALPNENPPDPSALQ